MAVRTKCLHLPTIPSNSMSQDNHLTHITQPHSLPYQYLSPSLSNSNQSLPSFDEVCQLNHPTQRFIPSKARPAFTRALSSTLKGILRDNNQGSWLKLLMLPKCTLPSIGNGRHDRLTPVDSLCSMWVENNMITLWEMAKNHVQVLQGQY